MSTNLRPIAPTRILLRATERQPLGDRFLEVGDVLTIDTADGSCFVGARVAFDPGDLLARLRAADLEEVGASFAEVERSLAPLAEPCSAIPSPRAGRARLQLVK